MITPEHRRDSCVFLEFQTTRYAKANRHKGLRIYRGVKRFGFGGTHVSLLRFRGKK